MLPCDCIDGFQALNIELSSHNGSPGRNSPAAEACEHGKLEGYDKYCGSSEATAEKGWKGQYGNDEDNFKREAAASQSAGSGGRQTSASQVRSPAKLDAEDKEGTK